MIDRRAHDRESKRDVHGAAKGHQLYGNEALIVIARDHRVEFAASRAHEDGVGRKWARHIDAESLRILDGGNDDLKFFLTQQAILARVRVEAGHGELRRVDAKVRQRLRGQRDYISKTIVRERRWDFT